MAAFDVVEVIGDVIDVTVTDDVIEVDVVEQVITVDVLGDPDITVEVTEPVIDVEIVSPATIVVEISDPIIGEEDKIVAALNKVTDDETAQDGSGFIYVGEAAPGVATSTNAWRVKRIEIVLDGSGREDTTTLWADGDGNFDNIWDDRVSLSYS